MQVKKNSKNGKIELLRFLCSLVIVFFHARNIIPSENVIFEGGAYAVEFFAIVSGYLLMASVEKIEKRSQCVSVGKETVGFIWKKIKGLCPQVIVAWIFLFSVRQLVNFTGAKNLIMAFLNGFFELTLVQMSGLFMANVNPVTWYISSMLIGMTILYPLLRKYKDFMIHVAIPLVVLLIMGWLGHEYGHLRGPQIWTGLCFKGNLRIFAELCIGILSYIFVGKLKQVEFTVLGKSLLMIFEWSGYIALAVYMQDATLYSWDFFFLIVWFISISISFSEQGIDAKLYNNRLCEVLGSISLPLYLTHSSSVIIVKTYFPIQTLKVSQIWISYLGIAMLNCIVLIVISYVLKKTSPKMLKKIRNSLIIEKSEL